MRSSIAGLLSNEPMSRHTRIGTGGPAAVLAHADSIGAARDAVLLSRERGWPLLVLGKGSNILVPDAGYCGAVLKLGGKFRGIAVEPHSGTVRAGGGASLMLLGLLLAREGYAGFAYMGVIPGSVGGAVRMNAGIDSEQAISKDFVRASALDPDTGEIIALEKKDLAFGYRTSCLAARPLIIMEAVFSLPSSPVGSQATLGALRALLKQRHAAQPRCYRTFGSTFRNPPVPERSAGWYLDRVGMRGVRLGGAMVAHEHANWIINTGSAATSDILGLMRMGRTRVLEAFDVRLEEEVVVIKQQ